MYEVKTVSRGDLIPFIMGIHYAKRFPSVSHKFGLYRDGHLVGVVTYGRPSSAPIRSGVAGIEFKDNVWELNRLCLRDNRKNEASILVSRSLKMLGNAVVVSFADPSHGHVGYVYQACNFLYTGLSAKRTDWAVRGMEHLHGQTIADEFRGMGNRSKLMREKYGEDFYLKDRPRKHRYITVVGSRRFKKIATDSLRYKTENYPKA